MQSGLMRHRCLIERKVTTPDPQYGNAVVSWVPVANAWCSADDFAPSRSEAIKNGLSLGVNQTIVRMRWRTDVDSSMRLTINRPAPTVYQIVGGPAELGNRQGVEFVVEKYTS